MNSIEINERITLLYQSLQFCTNHTKTFTTGERICINQERFQWLHILSDSEANPKPVSESIETKIQKTIKQINTYNYKPEHQNPFDYKASEKDF